MGTYVEYRTCPPSGPLEQILARINHFVEWYASDFADDADSQVLDLAMDLQTEGASAIVDAMDRDHRRIDRLVGEFYGFYAGGLTRPRPPLPPHVSVGALRVQRYRRLHAEMQGMLSTHTATLWRFIFEGRPVGPKGRRAQFMSDDGASWVSWWSNDEVATLRHGLPDARFHGSEETSHVLAVVHGALDVAHHEGTGLVVTAF